MIDRFRNKCSLYVLLAAYLSLLPGCGSSRSDGPERFELSGLVSFDQKPIPNGSIMISPNTNKGNRGPGVFATILDGKFETLPGKGSVGGPMIVEITGFDGVPVTVNGETLKSGSPLFEPYQMEIELPKEKAEQNFEVPVLK